MNPIIVNGVSRVVEVFRGVFEVSGGGWGEICSFGGDWGGLGLVLGSFGVFSSFGFVFGAGHVDGVIRGVVGVLGGGGTSWGDVVAVMADEVVIIGGDVTVASCGSTCSTSPSGVSWLLFLVSVS